MSTLEEWINAACLELGLERGDIDQSLILDLARDVAHGVARPGAPLTAYLLGLAVGRGTPARDAAARLTEMAEGWKPEEPEKSGTAEVLEVPEQAGEPVLDA
ncbi:DUF6457 domain-containing protein [Actinomadura chokoriensis]|uniref:DUF6457 domain-containing protein n=1 Tax=Actinomadura chokoriensis TaxID=454156 RepID=A0ABV4QXX9_9ACTN